MNRYSLFALMKLSHCSSGTSYATHKLPLLYSVTYGMVIFKLFLSTFTTEWNVKKKHNVHYFCFGIEYFFLYYCLWLLQIACYIHNALSRLSYSDPILPYNFHNIIVFYQGPAGPAGKNGFPVSFAVFLSKITY